MPPPEPARLTTAGAGAVAAESVAVPPGPSSAGKTDAARPRRLAWLDGLRGLAVLCVVFEHMSYHLFTGIRPVIAPWFSFGTYGVLVFFLVSGYIVPASLERRGSVRDFWTGRLLRLYPLLALILLATVALAAARLTPLRPGVATHPIGAVIAHATMLQDLLNVPNALNVLWTLSYEMLFYLLVTALFTVGLHDRSSVVALVLATAGVVAGGLLPSLWLSRTLGTNTVILVVSTMLVAGLACVTRDHRGSRRAGALIITVLVVVIVTMNSRIPWWQDMIVLSTMFSGTALYRAERGQTGAFPAVVVTIGVPSLSVGSALYWGGTGARQWAIVILAAWATFGVAMLRRRRPVPRTLCVLGAISYPLYLLHPLALDLFGSITGDQRTSPLVVQSGLALVFMAVLIVAGRLLHRYVELPAQRLGHRLTTRKPPTPA